MNLFNGKAKCNLCHPEPFFTDFTYENLGVPKNQENPFYDTDPGYVDNGLGGFLASVGYPMAAENMGKQKIPTLRNVDKRPGKGFTKAYMHNGVFKSLKEVVHFHNTRDVQSWPAPELNININATEVGNLGLTEEEEDAIIAFLKTLSDGYKSN
jgi:cytochrome c peroxidase